MIDLIMLKPKDGTNSFNELLITHIESTVSIYSSRKLIFGRTKNPYRPLPNKGMIPNVNAT